MALVVFSHCLSVFSYPPLLSSLRGVEVEAVSAEQVREPVGCSTGQTGPLCGVCVGDLGYVRAGVECEKCWDNTLNGAIVWTIILLFFALVAYLCYFGSKLSSANGDHSCVFRITINFLQMIGLMGAYKAGGTEVLKKVFNIASSSSGGRRCASTIIRFIDARSP